MKARARSRSSRCVFGWGRRAGIGIPEPWNPTHLKLCYPQAFQIWETMSFFPLPGLIWVSINCNQRYSHGVQWLACGGTHGKEWNGELRRQRREIPSTLISISYFSSGASHFTNSLLQCPSCSISIMQDTYQWTKEEEEAPISSFYALGQGWRREKSDRWLSPRLMGSRNMGDGHALGLSSHKS